MTLRARRIVVVDQSDPNRGRYDPERVGRYNPDDTEERPIVTPEDRQATREELAALRRRMTDEDAFFVPPEDIQATREELAELRRRMTRKGA